MKLFKLANVFVLAAVLGFAAAGCKHKQPDITKLPNGGLAGSDTSNIGPGGQMGPGTGVEPAQAGFGGGDAANFNPDDYNQDRNALAAETVYFDYDSSTIKSSEESKLASVASALKSDSSAKLLIEGNCDERGTEEYNRSLGERRALAAREALANAGVDAGRVATRSYGEDRPADHGHDQAAWAKNRRDEFVLLHPK